MNEVTQKMKDLDLQNNVEIDNSDVKKSNTQTEISTQRRSKHQFIPYLPVFRATCVRSGEIYFWRIYCKNIVDILFSLTTALLQRFFCFFRFDRHQYLYPLKQI